MKKPHFILKIRHFKDFALFILFLFAYCATSTAQTVKGTVTDESGEGLIGVTVVIEKSNTGTVTDANGDFTLTGVTDDDVIIVSYTGYKNQRIAWDGSSNVSIQLEEGYALEEIIVTADKRSANLQKAPVSITSIKGNSLRDLGLTSVDQVLRDVPNIQVQGAARGFVIAVRGIGSDLPPGVGESAVSTNYDGIYNFRAEAGTLGLYDLERVEALRGPQATLYGRNATGGVVNFISRDPNDQLGGYALVEAGNYNLLRTEGAINVPLSNKLAIRSSFASINRGGYLTNGLNDAVGTGLRTKLKYSFNDKSFIKFNYEYNKLGGKGFGFTTLDDFTSGNKLNNTTTDNQSQDYKSHKFWLDINAEVGPGILTILPSYQTAKGIVWGDNGMGLSRSLDPKEAIQTAMEVRYAAKPNDKVQWVLGYYYYGLENNISGFNGDGQDKTNSSSFFGQVTYPITDKFRAVAGLRYASDTKSFDFPTSMPPNGEENWKTVDWKAGLEASLSENTLTYLTVASGHRAGGFNSFPGAGGSAFEPESLTSYELGFKSKMSEDRLLINGAIFYYDYKDFQVADFYFPPGAPGPVLELTNHDVINKGFELETRYALTRTTNLKANFTYLNSTYNEDFVLHGGPLDPPDPLQLNGMTLPHAPALTINMGLDHTFVTENNLRITPYFNFRWTDERYVAPYLGVSQFQEAFSVIDFSVKVVAPNGRYSMTAYVRNATDYIQKMAFFANSIIPGSPRQIGVNMQVNF